MHLKSFENRTWRSSTIAALSISSIGSLTEKTLFAKSFFKSLPTTPIRRHGQQNFHGLIASAEPPWAYGVTSITGKRVLPIHKTEFQNSMPQLLNDVFAISPTAR